MIDGIEFWTYISRNDATRICKQFNLAVKKGYETKREIRLNEGDNERTFKRSGEFKYLKIEVRKTGGKYILTVHGSFHKFFHGNNKFSFSGEQVTIAVQGVCDLFGIDNNSAFIQNLEVGINLPVWFPVYKYLKSNLLFHKKKIFEKLGKVGFFVEYNDYIIKLYEKDFNILRFEIKYKAMAKLDLFGIRALADLSKLTINKLVDSLIGEWNQVVMRDGINIYDKKSWQHKITQGERDKLSDYTSSLFDQSYKEKLEEAEVNKGSLRVAANRLKRYCVDLIKSKGDESHFKLSILISEQVGKFKVDWK